MATTKIRKETISFKVMSYISECWMLQCITRPYVLFNYFPQISYLQPKSGCFSFRSNTLLKKQSFQLLKLSTPKRWIFQLLQLSTPEKWIFQLLQLSTPKKWIFQLLQLSTLKKWIFQLSFSKRVNFQWIFSTAKKWIFQLFQLSTPKKWIFSFFN